MPTQKAFQNLLSKALTLLKDDDEEDAISSDRLHKTTDASLDLIAPPPAYGPLLSVLDEHLSHWLHDTAPRDAIEVIVLPPCDEGNIIESWARRNDLECLEPPRPEAILSNQAVLPDIKSGTSLVIPRLEAWMMRTHYSMDLIRQLLSSIEKTDCKVVIACNIYAWEFLKKAVAIDSFLPEPMTFGAMDCDQLRDWLSSLHAQSDENNYKLCHQKSAQNIFDTDSDKNDSYFKVLAATSSGIPWVAWHFWRNGLLSQKENAESEDEDNDAKIEALADQDSDQQILWVAALKELSLPSSTQGVSLLVLQAILIHHKIAIEHLVKVLPDVRPQAAISQLKRAGIITQREDILSCSPEAYPAIREGLVASGFPVGVL